MVNLSAICSHCWLCCGFLQLENSTQLLKRGAQESNLFLKVHSVMSAVQRSTFFERKLDLCVDILVLGKSTQFTTTFAEANRT
jgi:hypothetical protein